MTFEEVWQGSSHITPLIFKEEGEVLFNHVMELLHGSTVVEIGSYVGKSSFILASACKQIDSKLICIDPFVNGFDGVDSFDTAKEMFTNNILKVFDNVKLLEMRSDDAHKYIKKIDYIFIDGSHDYADVLNDCKNYLPKLNSGGVVSFHDYHNLGLWGVKMAVDEYCNTWEVVDNVFSVNSRRKP